MEPDLSSQQPALAPVPTRCSLPRNTKMNRWLLWGGCVPTPARCPGLDRTRLEAPAPAPSHPPPPLEPSGPAAGRRSQSSAMDSLLAQHRPQSALTRAIEDGL